VSPTWHTIPSGGSVVTGGRQGSTVAALLTAGTPANREPAWLTVTGHEEKLRWKTSASRFEGRAYTLKAQGDTWAMGPDNQPVYTGGWRAVRSALYGGSDRASTALASSVNLSDSAFDPGGAGGTITVESTGSGHGPAFVSTANSFGSSVPYIRIRDNFISGVVGSGTTLTNCRVVQGSRGTIPAGEMVAQGDPGGWGFTSVEQIESAGALYAAGLRPEVSLRALLNSGYGTPEKKITAAAYWHQLDHGDVAPSPPADGSVVSGGLGVCGQLQSLASTGGASGGERSFYMTVPSPLWTAWALSAPTKAFLVPWIVFDMETGAVHPGTILDLVLMFRWVSA
jgi:hypothetical protein